MSQDIGGTRRCVVLARGARPKRLVDVVSSALVSPGALRPSYELVAMTTVTDDLVRDVIRSGGYRPQNV